MKKWVQVSCKGCETDLPTRFFCFALFFCLIITHSISFKFLKYLHKYLLQSRGPCLLPSEADVLSFSCFSSFTAVCFASSGANMSFFQLCHIVCNVPSHSPLICLCLSWNQKSQCLQTGIRNCFEGSDALLSLVIRQFFAEVVLLTASTNIIICEGLL